MEKEAMDMREQCHDKLKDLFRCNLSDWEGR